MDIDEAIDDLLAAMTRAGAPRVAPPSDLAALRELEAKIAPLRVPDAVRRFWQRVDASRLGARTYPALHGPDLALRSWLLARDEFPGLQPTALLQIAYESHQCMSVELDQPGVRGGALFEWNIVEGGFERRFDGLEGWLAYITELLDAGRFHAVDGRGGRVLLVPSPQDWEVERKGRPAPAPHPLYGATTQIGRDILDWPEHWRRLAGLTPAHIEPRGASRTIAEVATADPLHEVQATIVARVVSLVGSAAGTTVRVDDGTGELVVRCPAGTTLLGPTIDEWFEFDVLLPPGVRRLDAVATAVRRTPLESA